MGRGTGSRDILLGGRNRIAKPKSKTGPNLSFTAQVLFSAIRGFYEYQRTIPSKISFQGDLEFVSDINEKDYYDLLTDKMDEKRKELIFRRLKKVIDSDYSRRYRKNFIGSLFSDILLPKGTVARSLDPGNDWLGEHIAESVTLNGVIYDYDLIEALYLLHEKEGNYKLGDVNQYLRGQKGWSKERIDENIEALMEAEYLEGYDYTIKAGPSLTEIFPFVVYEKEV